MTYCLVNIRKCFVGEDYVQNHFDMVKYDSKDKALDKINELGATLLGSKGAKERFQDIRGHIINEGGDIYCYADANEEVHYFALVEMEESRRNAFLNG